MTERAELIDVEIPDEFINLASEWYCGDGDLLYAVASTGGLTLGSIRPRNEDGEPMSDTEWHVYLWDGLASDVLMALRDARKGHEDADALEDFATFCDDTADRLRKAYGLE